MKRNVVNALLGVAALSVTAISTQAQGSVWFDNYSFAGYSPVVWGSDPANPAPAGTYVDNTFSVALDYSFNAGANTGSIPAANISPDGYFLGGIVQIPGYAGGDITFTLTPTSGASDVGTTGQIQFTQTIATGATPAGFFDGLPAAGAWQVNIIPEPTTFALAGLGAAALLIFRRRD